MAPAEKPVSEDLCTRIHLDVDRRLSSVETSLNSNLERLHEKLDKQTLSWAQKATDNAKRPGWAVVAIIGFLSSLSVGLLVARAAGH